MNSKQIKLTFVYPDFENIGIEYLMSLAKKEGYSVNLVTYLSKNEYLSKNVRTNLMTIAKKVIDLESDVVCFSSVTDNYLQQLSVAKLVKKIDPKIFIIFGGIHPTAVPKVVLKEKVVDAVAIGESEISFLEFLRNCKTIADEIILPLKAIEGIVFKKENKIIGEFKEGKLINLDDLPFPDKKTIC